MDNPKKSKETPLQRLRRAQKDDAYWKPEEEDRAKVLGGFVLWLFTTVEGWVFLFFVGLAIYATLK